MCALSRIWMRRRTSRPITRRPGAPAATGSPADAWMTYGIADVMNLLRLTDAGESGRERARIERQKIDALIGYCETVSCRRQVLLGYFGERDHQPCGNCDNCREPPRPGTGRSRRKRRFPRSIVPANVLAAHYLVDVLLGVRKRSSSNASDTIS